MALVSSCVKADKIINLDNYFGNLEYNPKTKYLFECMYNSFAEAKKIRDEWEKIYGRNTDYQRLNKYGEEIISSLVTEKSEEGNGKVYKRFFGTLGQLKKKKEKNRNYTVCVCG